MAEAEGIKQKFAWGKKSEDQEATTPPIVSFVEILEEQSLEAENSYEQYKNNYTGDTSTISFTDSLILDESGEPDCSKDFEIARELASDPDCSLDEYLAQKLQREFDRETELNEKFEQSRAQNGKATAVLSSDPYHYMQEAAEESGDEEEDDDFREFATNLLYSKLKPDFPPCGFKKTADGEIITKHDRDLNEKKNSSKAMQLPLALPTGDVVEHRLSSKVYNELRSFGKTETKRQMRVKDKEEKATSEMSMDAQTRLLLMKWINMGDFDRVEEVIATGKESAVLHAVLDGSPPTDKPEQGSSSTSGIEAGEEDAFEEEVEQETSPENGTHFAIKVYRTSLQGFRNRIEYVKDDFRFKNPRGVMKIWAEKEFMNLKRLRRANIKCPMPIKLRKHALLMSMIGGTRPAPKLKELQWTGDQMKLELFGQVKEIVIRMFKTCRLVHGDLSEFNLLVHEGAVYVIDVAQAMDISHPSSLVYLHRDIVNVLEFFGKIGCEPLPTPTSLFTEVTGIEFDSEKDLLTQVESFERDNRNVNIRDAKAHPADLELRLYQAESTGRGDSPSRPYN